MPDGKTKITGLESGVIERSSKDAQGRFIKGFSKAVDVEKRTITGVASTINLDRHGDVILPSAVAAHAEAFMASNAPFLSAHTHRTSEGAPSQIGWVTDMKIDAEKVLCEFKFARTAAAEEWWRIASDRDGKGIAFSIGFLPIRYIYGTVKDIIKEFPELGGPLAGMKDDDKLWVLTEIELIEISAVPCPANRESLQELAQKFFDGDDTEAKAPKRGDGDHRMQKLVDALTESIGDALGEKLLEELGTQLEVHRRCIAEQLDDAISEMKSITTGDALGGGCHAENLDCDDSDPDDGAGDEDQGDNAVADACDGLLATAGGCTPV